MNQKIHDVRETIKELRLALKNIKQQLADEAKQIQKLKQNLKDLRASEESR